jgi:hypothetical protein
VKIPKNFVKTPLYLFTINLIYINLHTIQIILYWIETMNQSFNNNNNSNQLFVKLHHKIFDVLSPEELDFFGKAIKCRDFQ